MDSNKIIYLKKRRPNPLKIEAIAALNVCVFYLTCIHVSLAFLVKNIFVHQKSGKYIRIFKVEKLFVKALVKNA